MLCELWEGAEPCIKCGKCCRMGICAFGEYNEQGGCRFLTEQNLCGQYDLIVESPPEAHADFSPAFGAGCCLRAKKGTREAALIDILFALKETK